MSLKTFFKNERVQKVSMIVTGVLAALILVVMFQSSEFRVTRSAEIARSPGAVAGYVNDLRNWNNWSPWAQLDLKAKYEFEGPLVGEGAIFKWDGNANVGAGKMTIIEVKPGQLVRMQLDFERPFAGQAFADFTFERKGRGTLVTWTMTGHNNFMAKLMSLLIDCDEMMGGFFETGLANLKRNLEAYP